MSTINYFIKTTARTLGIEVDRIRPYKVPVPQLVRICEENSCSKLLDIGANTGQFAREVWDNGFSGTITSFEPQEVAHALLVDSAREIENWKIASRMCIGDKEGTTKLNIAANSVSSSVLPVLESSTSAQEDTAYVASEEVPMRQLDNWILENMPGNTPIAVKIDVQGFEDRVLRGLGKSLSRIIAFKLEMSLVPLYQGAPSFIDLFSTMEVMGFTCVGLYPGFTDQKTFQMLQVDGLFARS